MACQTCGRVGLCDVCCCVDPDHYGHLPNLIECRLCKHPTRLAAEPEHRQKRGL